PCLRCGRAAARGRPLPPRRGGRLDPLTPHVDATRRAGHHAALDEAELPEAPGPRHPRPRPRLGRDLRRRPGLLHPEGGRLVAARPLEARPGPHPRLPRRTWRPAEALCAEGGGEVSLSPCDEGSGPHPLPAPPSRLTFPPWRRS